ncbi:hypothetical protein SAMN04487905_106208 [Actinopolyspora xinjiangensis]|uniref:Uncharacterized protein n=1 Tax=Actinopolyspora xinjiangensis TaxID=405564 RepID=A0A1H0UDK2_9ACTN|nr:DUF6247 family protein [Actinopolyspora xinjiangensis]SDP64095.1 hypothetical protein SAMN04487905_106208 [Actinopolyspora xinjiangensis]
MAPPFPREARCIREALDRADPQRRAEFDRDFQEALKKVAEDYDTGHIDTVLDDWWGAAILAEYPPTEQEDEIKARADRGDFSGLIHIDEHRRSWREDEHGNLWRTDENGDLWRQSPAGKRERIEASTTPEDED